MKKFGLLLLFLCLFSSFAFSTTYAGNGDFSLYINDSVDAPVGLSAKLVNVGWSYSQSQAIVLTNATFQIFRGSDLVYNRTIAVGERFNYSHNSSGIRNITVRLDQLLLNSSSATAYYAPSRPYASVRITSSYTEPTTPPAPLELVRVTSFTGTASHFYIDLELETNASANLTLYYKNGTQTRSIQYSNLQSSRSIRLNSLKSYTNHTIWAVVCTVNSCNTSNNLSIRTLPITPEITNVTHTDLADTSVRIIWKTDVASDSKVYYRKSGTTDWTQVPPPDSLSISDLLVFYEVRPFVPTPDPVDRITPGDDITNSIIPGVIPGVNQGVTPIADKGINQKSYTKDAKTANLAGGSYSGYAIPGPIGSASTIGGEYSVNSDVLGSIVSSDLSRIVELIKVSHSVNLLDLDDDTTYQYKVSSCADLCANSSIYSFKTKLTVYTPVAFLTVPAGTSIKHGTSAVFNIRAKSQNPGGTLKVAKLSWFDAGAVHNINLKFGGDLRSPLTAAKSEYSIASITFTDPGSHVVTLTVEDSYNLTSVRTATITVAPKSECTATSTIYYPSDTPCNDKWPSGGGNGISYNNGLGACNAIEVCSDNLDYMNRDAEMCCNGRVDSFSSQPTKNRGYDYSKTGACDQALADTRAKGPLTSLGTDSSMKFCKAAYLVRSIGSSAVYMKDYYTAEACCKDASFCGDFPRYQAYNPWPMANIKYNELWCYYWDFGLFGKSPKDGWYGSDTNPADNNNALADFPAHASVNTMNTGTCVDYSFVVTTALRKSGFKKNEILSMRTPGHLYNVVWLPGDSKYSFIDTVGNTGGDFFTGPGWGWKSGGKDVNHCSYSPDKCSSDEGMKTCPAKSMVSGC